MADGTELERLSARRVTLIYRLDLIAKGATITYDDGSPVDMASEKPGWRPRSPSWIAASKP